MKLYVHLLAFNEEVMLPWALRHWFSMGVQVFVHDAGSNDETRKLAKDMGAIVVDWDTGGKFNDMAAIQLKNTCWHGTTADWVICADMDELLWFPEGWEKTFAAYEHAGIWVVKPHGFEMFKETLPEGPGQIYEYVKYGAPDDYWYAKPILFNPRRVQAMHFDPGCHSCSADLLGGGHVKLPIGCPATVPPCFLLHYHHVGPIGRIAKRYDAALARQSESNLKCGHGNRLPGIEEANRKRTLILKNIHQVVP